MKEVRGCELCSSPARVHCESDQASLCWNCDAKVHGANFLVARHPRSLLCRSCQSPTPWIAAGPNLGSAMSLCQRCGDRDSPGGGALIFRPAVDPPEDEEIRADGERSAVNNEEIDADDDYSDDDEDEDRDVAVVEDEAENQVVPLSSTPPPLSGAPTASSSEVEVERNSECDPSRTRRAASASASLKRSRSHSIDLNQCFQDDETTSVDSVTPPLKLKERRTESEW